MVRRTIIIMQEQKRRIETDTIMEAYLKSGKNFDEINLKYTGIFLDLFLNYAFCPVRNLVSFHLFKTTAIKLDRIIAMAKLHIANTPDGTFPFNKVITK